MRSALAKQLLLPLTLGLTLAGAALAQGQVIFPPVPGPYMLEPPRTMPAPNAERDSQAMGRPVFPAPGVLEAPGPQQPRRPQQFSGPVGGMRVPYWMQQTPRPNAAPPGQTENTQPSLTDGAGSRPAVMTETPSAAAPQITRSAPQQSAPRYGQAGTPGTFPGYMAPAQPWRQPAAQAPAGGWQQPVAPGWQQQAAPGWGYGQPAPGWSGTPYLPQPGWGYPSGSPSQQPAARQ